jgi:PHD/YefM family antitoxin component YafN of YafNO toxin-antitoxin module
MRCAPPEHALAWPSFDVVTYLLLLWHLRSLPVTKTIVSSRAFNQDASGAKRAARNGPVIITDRGRPAHVLLTIEAYQKLTHTSASINDLLAMPGVAEIPFEAPRMGSIARPADLD